MRPAKVQRRLDEGVGATAGRPRLVAHRSAFEYLSEPIGQLSNVGLPVGEIAEEAVFRFEWSLESVDTHRRKARSDDAALGSEGFAHAPHMRGGGGHCFDREGGLEHHQRPGVHKALLV